MIDVTGIRFKSVGKIYYFDAGNLVLKAGDHVIVETSRGVEYGTVVIAKKSVTDDEIVPPLKKILRKANDSDEKAMEENKKREREAFEVCQEKIRSHNLEMKLIDVEYTFDHNKVLFYFTADGRVDFRDLVRDLAGVFKTRIELRQIGVRDESKMMGGLGICGRQLCCNLFLSDFVPVSIKMAKEQNLSLNPTKISGTCGRLMCCLKHEQEVYESIAKTTPGVGSIVKTEDGKGQVTAVSPLKGIVTVAIEKGEEKELKDFKVEDVKILKKTVIKNDEKIDMAELKKLEKD
ncbi:MAG: stage 0 sporulation family protein [Clostridia bacterium]|nr:stage 0 sporulation family protein [Clostridia bacterium]